MSGFLKDFIIIMLASVMTFLIIVVFLTIGSLFGPIGGCLGMFIGIVVGLCSGVKFIDWVIDAVV